MLKVMVAAPESNSGKTAITCALLSMLKERGLNPCAFKCGPDYIDPMFHRTVLGIDSSNLDVFLAGEEGVRKSFEKGCQGFSAVVCEGVMGYYDGMSSESPEGSAWHIARMLDIPTILILRPRGSALTLAAIVKGLSEFRDPGMVRGVLLNQCSENFFKKYGPSIERETGIPILGYLPNMEEADFESRHLGLMTAGEIDDIEGRIKTIGKTMEKTIDVNRLLAIMDDGKNADEKIKESENGITKDVKIGVAKDEAFNFTYAASIKALEDTGAEIIYFSPIEDKVLPEGISAIYLPGGYPELHAKALSENTSMKEDIHKKIASGMPTVAECGGFLYLNDSLEDDKGETWQMVGLFGGHGSNAGHIVRFGYGNILPEEDSMLFRKGEKIPVHEFHYWDTTEVGGDLVVEKYSDKTRECFGYARDNIYAGFPHLYFGGGVDMAERFVNAARKWKDRW